MALSEDRKRRLKALAAQLGVDFVQLTLLNEALTHPSYAHEHQLNSHYERLEFLGDAVVGLVVSHLLYKQFPTSPEGTLSRIKANLVSASHLAQIGNALQLSDLILLGKGEQQSIGRGRQSIVANAVEAVVGAIYLDQSWSVTHRIITQLWEPAISRAQTHQTPISDAKSALQELLQAQGGTTPTYRLASAEGPDHAKVFCSEVLHNGKILGSGVGRSKKEAEQEAARQAFEYLGKR